MKEKLLSDKVESKINELIGEELTAMYAYMAMANWCQDAGFLKAYDFFLAESADEKAHSEIWQKYVLDLGCVPKLPKIDQPNADFKTLQDVIYAAYDMEVALGEKYSDFALELIKSDAMTFTKNQEFIAIQTKSIGFFGDMCSVADGLSKEKFQQLELEEALVENAG